MNVLGRGLGKVEGPGEADWLLVADPPRAQGLGHCGWYSLASLNPLQDSDDSERLFLITTSHVGIFLLQIHGN